MLGVTVSPGERREWSGWCIKEREAAPAASESCLLARQDGIHGETSTDQDGEDIRATEQSTTSSDGGKKKPAERLVVQQSQSQSREPKRD